MIKNAEEFDRLWDSDKPEDYHRITEDVIPDKVCLDIMKQYPKLKRWLGCNQNLSLKIITLLANDKDRYARWEAAQKENLTLDLFELLSKDPDEGIRHRIACNAKVPLHILERLTHDEVDHLREDAQDIYKERLASGEKG